MCYVSIVERSVHYHMQANINPSPTISPSAETQADICLFLEGTYPYVVGGVSTWIHELIEAQSHLTFDIVAILSPGSDTTPRYKIPGNIRNITEVYLQQMPDGIEHMPAKQKADLFKRLEMPLLNIQTRANIKHLEKLLGILHSYQYPLGSHILMDSKEAWRMLLRMYNSTMGDSSFLDYFWSWRALFGGLFSILLAPMPKASVYHALCTGYAGLFLARAHIETGKPCMITEHGIYTNERRIEIASADWLDDGNALNFNVVKSLTERNLRDFWVDTFTGYSRLCYEVCDYIITLYEGNKDLQISDGADPEKLWVIPNGIDYERYSSIERSNDHPPTIALIGRVVPIKDIKTYIRVAQILQEKVPDLQALILGPTDEDEDYHSECVEMVEHYNLQDVVKFTGKVKIDEYLGKIDVLVLTSISEAQPLVILEAGAIGIPSVATDVGSCREMIYGHHHEYPELGVAGGIGRLSNPQDIAAEVGKLLLNREHYKQCSNAIKKRVEKYYNKKDLHNTYRNMYELLIKLGRHVEWATKL